MAQGTRRLLGTFGLAIGTALVGISAAPVAAASSAPLKVSVTGSLQITAANEFGPTNARYGGQGSGSPPLGPVNMAGDITVTGPASCANGFAATHVDVLTAKDGAQLEVRITEESCPTAMAGAVVTFSCTGTYTITGGTGRYAAATGGGIWSGTLNLDMGTGLGDFNAKYLGTISVRG